MMSKPSMSSQTTGCRRRLRRVELDKHQHGGLASDSSGHMALASIDLPRVLVAAKRNLSRSHLHTLSIHRLDKPAPRQWDDPLWLWILMPRPGPTGGKNGDEDCRAVMRLGALPLRLHAGSDCAELEIGHRTLRLAADAFGVG